MKLQKLTIKGYEKAGDKGTGESQVGDVFEVQINPATITIGKKIIRNKEKKPHGRQAISSLGAVDSDTLSFELLFDGTGLVGGSEGSDNESVGEKIQRLEQLAYDFQSESHQSNFLEIKWGKYFLFRGYLTSIQINKTLFDVEGNTLRAKLNLSFEGFIPPAKFERDKSFASPDMSHIKFANESNTLAKYCKDIYGNPRYMIQIAHFNQLVNFRKLKAGQRLEFPPLRNTDYV